MKYLTTIVLLAFTVTGCDRSRGDLAKALTEARAAEAQKDSLLTEVLETTQFVSDLNGELARAKIVAIGSDEGDRGVPGSRQDQLDRQATLTRISQVIERLNESEVKLTETENRVK